MPPGVAVEIKGGQIEVKGPRGQLARVLDPRVQVKVEGQSITVAVKNENEKRERSLWGTYAAHIKNMVVGVSQGFKKQLEINGVGYRVAMQGKDLRLEVGFSHPVVYAVPAGVQASVEKNLITLESADKELLGKAAAEVRNIRKPEPYKGKGIKYLDEIIRRKAGKTVKSGE